MELTSKQVMGVLKVGKLRLERMIKEGRITPINTRKEGAKKFFARFDERAVKALRRELIGENPEPYRVPKAPVAPLAIEAASNGHGSGILTRLDHIEQALARLEALWR